MGADVAVPLFGPLIIIGVAILVYFAVLRRDQPLTEASILGIGGSRLAAGYLGVLLMVFLISYAETVEVQRYELDHGLVSAAEADKTFFEYLLVTLCILTPFFVFITTAFALPLASVVQRYGFVSLVGVVAVGQMTCFGCAVGFFVVVGLADKVWCTWDVLTCLRFDYSNAAARAGAMAIAFGIAARLPFWRSSPRID